MKPGKVFTVYFSSAVKHFEAESLRFEPSETFLCH